VRTLPGFQGIVYNAAHTAIDNSHSGPDGVTTHGRWLYAGDGNSTLKVFDLFAQTVSALKQTIPTGGTTRVDEMSLTADGKLLLAVNNAEDPPYGTLFAANGDAATSNVTAITKVMIASSILPTGAGLGFEQSTWDPQTQRFYHRQQPAGLQFQCGVGSGHLQRRHGGDRSDDSFIADGDHRCI
jgi:hypothetical protein